MTDRPLILVTNDDGVNAKGLKELIEVVQLFGEVVVIAPEISQSGKSAAITVDLPLKANQQSEEGGLVVYKCNGTPVDCIKLGFNQLLDRKPDYVVSGINHGANSSISVIYSGTVGGAIEGSLHGVPSVAFSLNDFSADADFSKSKIWCAKVFQMVIEKGLPEFTCLNVNIPAGIPEGIKVVRQTKGKWVEEFDKRTDPHGREYYWLSGYFQNLEEDAEETDIHALENGFVTVVPVNVDMTCYRTLEQIKDWKF